MFTKAHFHGTILKPQLQNRVYIYMLLSVAKVMSDNDIEQIGWRSSRLMVHRRKDKALFYIGFKNLMSRSISSNTLLVNIRNMYFKR